MMKSIRALLKQLKERYHVPRRVQDVIPINRIWTDGIFMVGHHQFAKTWRFTDINYLVASREDKERMFLSYSELLNSLDSGSSVKITIIFILSFSSPSVKGDDIAKAIRNR